MDKGYLQQPRARSSPLRGMTILELLTATFIMALLIVSGHHGWTAFSKRIAVVQTLRSATSALQTARFQAIEQNRSVRVTLRQDHFVLQRRRGKVWDNFLQIAIPRRSRVSMNASPVFTPHGRVAPLCSIYVNGHRNQYRISLSMAGRIKVQARRLPAG